MLLIVGLLCTGVGLAWSAQGPVTLPDEYIVTGTLRLPYAEIAEPFMAFYSTKLKKSRVDYYGKTVQTFQITGDGKTSFGQSFKVAPMTTETVLNKKMCFLVNGTKDDPITMQTVLPDTTNFTKIGQKMIGGKNCTGWQSINKIGNKKNIYTLWVEDTGYPALYEMFGYDTLLGSHYDKYYVDYVDWETPAIITDKTFEIPADVKPCGGFPGPGNTHHHLVNPMREYIHHRDDHVYHMFNDFKIRHSKNYASAEEHHGRFHTFRNNLRYIESQNRRGLSYSLAVNHMADLRDAEMKVMRGYHASKGYNGGKPFEESLLMKDVPESMDWRLHGAVTQVKDQAVCGSCWSFGTSGTVEGAHFLKTGQLVRLSQQALMDCSWGEGNNACDGGEDFRAYKWIMKHGLPSEETYGPYLAQDSYCHVDNKTAPAATMKGYVNVTSGSTKALQAAIALKGPISVAIDASHKSLSFYSNGVYYEPKCGSTSDDLDHAVLAVGYGVLNGESYWLVKNSWSTYWGNDGYVLMSQKDNNCGVATAATYVLM